MLVDGEFSFDVPCAPLSASEKALAKSASGFVPFVGITFASVCHSSNR